MGIPIACMTLYHQTRTAQPRWQGSDAEGRAQPLYTNVQHIAHPFPLTGRTVGPLS
jgi:hypothetical protein